MHSTPDSALRREQRKLTARLVRALAVPMQSLPRWLDKDLRTAAPHNDVLEQPGAGSAT
jgi:hypothetical protein